jgi:pyruvate kinase
MVGTRRTKIVGTIGPASSAPEVIDRLVAAGLDAARLNFSHGTHDDHARRAEIFRGAQKRAGRPLALIADLQGPKVRVGELAAPVLLTSGQEIVVAGEGASKR